MPDKVFVFKKHHHHDDGADPYENNPHDDDFFHHHHGANGNYIEHKHIDTSKLVDTDFGDHNHFFLGFNLSEGQAYEKSDHHHDHEPPHEEIHQW